MDVQRLLAVSVSNTPRWVRRNGSALVSVIVCGVLAASVFPAAGQASEQRDGLVIEYRFEGNAADSSGNAFHGTIHGQPQFGPGKTGSCVQLDGQQDYIDSGTTLADLGQTFTVECWVNPAAQQNSYVDIFGNHSGGGYGLVIEQSADNTNCFAGAYGAGGGLWISLRPVRLVANQWQHLALVKTPTELRLYVNGVPVERVQNDAPMLPSPLTLRVGDSIAETKRCFRGQIDEFRVWRTALTEFDSAISPKERLETLARGLRIQVRTATANESAPNEAVTWGFALDELFTGSIPEAVQQILVELEAEEWRSDCPVTLPPVTLTRQSHFKAEYRPPLAPGHYRVRYTPVMVVDAQRLAGRVEVFSSAVFGKPHRVVAELAGPPSETPPPTTLTRAISLDGNGWFIATDSRNQGRVEDWPAAPVPDAQPTQVPWPIQDTFPDYHGVAWYWRHFTAPASPFPDGRYLLRFHAVDYLAEVWVNGVYLGNHEGGETPFVLDATNACHPGEQNTLALRVLNPTYEPIDGLALKQTASGAKQYPVATNSAYNCGGILDSVQLLLTPGTRVEDLHVIPDWKTGEIRVQVNVRNTATQLTRGMLQLTAAPAAGGESIASQCVATDLAPGDTLVEAILRVPDHQLWQLHDPYLYRITARVQAVGSTDADELTVRCGFRDFRFENGYFRLNGQRIFPHGTIQLSHYPIGYTWPPDLDWMRRDVLHMKAVGINLCRLSFGGTLARQLEVFDELGVMVCMEHYGSWQMEESSSLKRRFERSLGEIVLRDRNHPSVVAWGIMNETGAGDAAFAHGVQSLSLVRWLDPNRMCFLNSGRWDGNVSIGSVSNPGSFRWDGELGDTHGYPPFPHPAGLLQSMRTSSTPHALWSGTTDAAPPTRPEPPLFVSEYGLCGAVDLARTLRRFEQSGKPDADDARYYRRQMEKFIADWQTWKLDQIWARPEDYFVESHGHFAKLRRIGENALRANPHLVAFSSTHPIVETGFCGSGTTNSFRELKPGLIDAAYELAAPLRWSLFVEPVNVYRGTRVHVEAVLANEDVLPPGKYPVRLQVVGPKVTRAWETKISIDVPPGKAGSEPPFAQAVFAEDVMVDGPAGKYRFLVTMLQGGAPQGGETEFYVSDPAEMPAVPREVVLWGDDVDLHKWLVEHDIPSRSFDAEEPSQREVILASGRVPAPGGTTVFAGLARRTARGATVVFLDPSMFADGTHPTRWLPLKGKGFLAPINWVGGYYRADMWAKDHPIFEGLPCGGLMDPTFYREILPQHALLKSYTANRTFTQEEVTVELDQPDEAVSGANRLSANYASGLHIAVYRLGAGRFILNNLLVRENLGRVPAAERLLRNMLNYAALEVDRPLAELPANFSEHLRTIGFESEPE